MNTDNKKIKLGIIDAEPEVVEELLSNDNQYILVPANEDVVHDSGVRLICEFQDEPDFTLTQQQIVILELLEQGKKVKEIQEIINRSYHTVKNHIYNLEQKMEVNSIAEAVFKYRKYKGGRR